MARIAIALLSGLIFGLGLTVAQMVNPAKVLGFLDIAGDWDPSLALVLLGAIPLAALGYKLAQRRRVPLAGGSFALPNLGGVDWRLIAGAMLFGAGWGLVGYCPGPALASIALGNPTTLLYVAAMIAGMVGFALWPSRVARR